MEEGETTERSLTLMKSSAQMSSANVRDLSYWRMADYSEVRQENVVDRTVPQLQFNGVDML